MILITSTLSLTKRERALLSEKDIYNIKLAAVVIATQELIDTGKVTQEDFNMAYKKAVQQEKKERVERREDLDWISQKIVKSSCSIF